MYLFSRILNKDKPLNFIFGIVIFRLLLDYIYSNTISSLFGYMGFDDFANIWSICYSWTLLIFMLFIIVRIYKDGNFSSYVLTMIFILAFVPVTSLLMYMPISIHYMTLISVYWAMLFTGYWMLSAFKFHSSSFKSNDTLIFVIALILSVIIVYVSGRFFSFRIHLNLLDVYDLREEQRLLILPTILKYLISIAGTVLPVVATYFFYRKRAFYAFLILLVLLLDFSIGGHKSILLKLLVSFLGFYFYNLFQVKYIPWILSIISVLAILEEKILESYYIITFLIRRALFVHPLLNNYYYDYFSKSEPDYLKQGMLRWFGFESNYKTPIPILIGETYFGRLETNANNGLFSDGFSNFGDISVIVYPFFIISILKMFDWSVSGLNVKLYILPVVVFTITIISTNFTTALLTNGILFLLFVLSLMKRTA